MNTADTLIFNKAVGLAQSGSKSSAFLVLDRLRQTNPNDVNLLLWIAFTTPNILDAKNIIDQATLIEPNNPNVANANSWLMQQQKQSALIPPAQTKEQLINDSLTKIPSTQILTPNSVANLDANFDSPLTINRSKQKQIGWIGWFRLAAFGVFAFAVIFGGIFLFTGNTLFTPTYTSPDHKYSIYMPQSIETRSYHDTTPQGASLTYYSVVAQLAGNVGFYAVSYTDLTPLAMQKLKPDDLLQAMMIVMALDRTQIIPKNITSEKSTVISMGQYPGRDAEFQNAEGAYLRLRAYLIDSRIYVLVVQADPKITLPIEPQKFLDSFKLL